MGKRAQKDRVRRGGNCSRRNDSLRILVSTTLRGIFFRILSGTGINKLGKYNPLIEGPVVTCGL